MLKPEVERMRALLVDAITTLCRSGLRYNCELKVEGLIGITLDEADIILVNLNKTFGSRFEEVTSSNKKLGKLDAVTTTTQTDTSQDADDDGDGEAGVEDLDTSAVIGKTETLEYPAEPASPDVSGERHKSRKRSERSGSRDSSPTSHVKRVRSNSAGAATGVQDSIQIQSSFTLQSGSEETSGESQASGSSSKAAAPITTDTDTARQVQSRLSTPEFSTPIPGRDPEKPMVKIEIDSDSDVEEVKNEPGALDSCRLRTDASLQLSQDFSQSSQAFQPADMSSFMGTNTSAHPGELYPTQLLHTDLAAGHQQELTIPASAYSSLMAPMPGPSRLTMPPHGGATSATGIPPDGQQQLEADGTPKAKPIVPESISGSEGGHQFPFAESSRDPSRPPRVFRDRANPLDYMNDEELIQKYRLSRACIFQLCETLKKDLERPTKRGYPLPVSLQVVSALSFFVTGGFQSVSADIHGISSPSMSRVVQAVAKGLCDRAQNYIKFPSDSVSLRALKQQFMDESGFPNVLGAVGTTLIPVVPFSTPSQLRKMNRGGINVQGICDAKGKFTNAVVKWPGSCPDGFIWENCSLSKKFREGEIQDGWLLGGHSYPLQPYLLTPIRSPETQAEEKYNQSHQQVNSIIRKAFSLMKTRFRCVSKSFRGMKLAQERAVSVTMAAFVLHNICVANNLPLNEPLVQDEEEDLVTLIEQPDSEGAIVRKTLIQTHFNQ